MSRSASVSLISPFFPGLVSRIAANTSDVRMYVPEMPSRDGASAGDGFSTRSIFSRVRFFFSSRRRHTRLVSDWSSDVCSSDLVPSRSNTYSENGKARRLLGCELGERRRRLPHFHPDDREALLFRVFEDETRDAFDGRIAVEQKDRLAELSKRRHERIVVSQQHLVIELLVDPAFDHAFDVAEVADPVAIVEYSGANLDLG